MERIPEVIPVPENEAENRLKTFRDQVRGIAEQEKRGEVPGKHLILDNFNPDDLTEEDMAIWEKFQSGEITEDDLRTYQQSIANGVEIKVGELPKDSRSLFCGFITNVAGEIFMRHELEKEKKQKTS